MASKQHVSVLFIFENGWSIEWTVLNALEFLWHHHDIFLDNGGNLLLRWFFILFLLDFGNLFSRVTIVKRPESFFLPSIELFHGVFIEFSQLLFEHIESAVFWIFWLIFTFLYMPRGIRNNSIFLDLFIGFNHWRILFFWHLEVLNCLFQNDDLLF